MKIAISTGGGDAPGLNAVIRAVVLSATARGWTCAGILRGFGSLLSRGEGAGAAWLGPERRKLAWTHGLMPLGPEEVRGITQLGGTILGASNRGNPFRWPSVDKDGHAIEVDRSDELIKALRDAGVDALVIIGGDGSLSIAHDLWLKGMPVVGVPKTIDNDVWGTESTFGFDTAVSTATEAIDKLVSTAMSHDRVMVVELMGRYTGWIALHSGISGDADVILIPEIPFDSEKVCQAIRDRESQGKRFGIVVVAEGATPRDGELALLERGRVGQVERLGGIAAQIADLIARETGKETRTLVLGHLQRGGSPTTFDRLLALRFGSAAVRAIADGAFGSLVVYSPPNVERRSLADVVGRTRLVPLESGVIMTARSLGISFGD
ncbi:MAG TPA: ATP-dependent 6-phosphofructokinase [Gemmatimonadales bacterium]|nr:ATP-dependent 6-phosphofructokinase [Gemmatimonadales bacterium]